LGLDGPVAALLCLLERIGTPLVTPLIVLEIAVITLVFVRVPVLIVLVVSPVAVALKINGLNGGGAVLTRPDVVVVVVGGT
jgi:hypothetical protein